MKLTDLLTIIYGNRDTMLAKYPQLTKVVIDIHNNMVLTVDKAMKST